MDPHRCNCLSLLLLRPTIPGISSPSATHTFQDNSMCRGEERRGNCTFRSATHTFARITLYRTTGRGILSLSPPRHTLLPRIPCIAALKGTRYVPYLRDTHFLRQFHVSRGGKARELHISLRDTHFCTNYPVSHDGKGAFYR